MTRKTETALLFLRAGFMVIFLLEALTRTCSDPLAASEHKFGEPESKRGQALYVLDVETAGRDGLRPVAARRGFGRHAATVEAAASRAWLRLMTTTLMAPVSVSATRGTIAIP